MLTLFLDLASYDKVFALVSDEKTESILHIDDQKQEEKLMETIESMLSSIKKNLHDLSHIACIVGPGGFTSLRIAVAMANALSFSLHIPLAGIHLADLYAARMSKKDFIWVHSTRKTHLFMQGFGEYQSMWADPTLVRFEELIGSLPHHVDLIGELIPEHQERIHLRSPDQSLEEILPSLTQTLEYRNDQTLMPWYGRGAS